MNDNFLFYRYIENRIKLRGDEHHHCTKVLRNQAGAQISVTDGKGHMFLNEIVQTNNSKPCAE
ncbi:MAG: hypothetical protein IPJ13_23265 [Saprospiraceae bacterium]|nr:hypothetical protein [Saprospiraceae bacterium]